ncbi:MAG: non-ribosomal peptide synthetase, partial [Candidatus Electrothrix sp. MAN1_4]|nr:non-ribosomal peptide synthetase [Candidatus Electrothrix sp. MAN1_4]
MHETFHVELSLNELFNAPSIAQLSEYILEAHYSDKESPTILPAIIPDIESRYQPFPLNDIQQAYWLGRSQAITMGNLAPHFYLEIDCQLFDIKRLELAWQLLTERHEMLRAIVLPSGQQKILNHTPYYEFRHLDLSSYDKKEKQRELDRIRSEISGHLLDPSEWPLFDIRVTQLNEKSIRLHFALDLLVADGWSSFVLSHEWWLLYQNPELKLEPLTLSFRDYILAEQTFRQEVGNIAHQEAQEYWHNRLSTLPPAPQLPLARLPEAIEKPSFNARSFKFNIKQWQLLKDKAVKAQVTPSTLLLTIYADILTMWSKSAQFTLN